MKKILLLVLIILLFSSGVYAEIPPSDKKQVQEQVMHIAKSVNNNDIDAIINILSENARPELRDEIETNLGGKMIQFQQTISSYEELGENKVKVKGKFGATGPGWNINGLSNYYVLEKSGDTWLLVDTDFHKKMGGEYVFEIIGKIFVVVIPVIILLMIFWIWMLIDAIKREFENKTVWIVLIVILGFIGAGLYFFIVRRKLKKQEKTTAVNSQQSAQSENKYLQDGNNYQQSTQTGQYQTEESKLKEGNEN